jgi:5-methylcytosine-specific restriction endonuclease McrA
VNPHHARVAQRAEHRCEYCRAPEAIFNFPFEVEHVVPLSRGGVDNESNLALACRACNLHKADHRTGVDEETQTVVSLFHPRQDRWEDHFGIDTEIGAIQGITPVGRGTIARLQINTPLQLSARQLWIRLGLFP